MIARQFWLGRINESWQKAPIVWLCGVRRSGKTTLAQSLGGEVLYLNCDLPSTRERVRDPELFYRSCGQAVIVFDEIHQLDDPTRILKIGADAFPELKILATGSSTLAATRKFRDALTGRKRTVHLTPVLLEELDRFGSPLLQRLYHGGLPQALLAERKDPGFYREWMDSYFVRDIQRLFAFRDPDKFNALFEYLLRQSGGLFEISKASRALGITRATVESHLRALEITQAATLVRPFHGGGQKELVKMPKVYAFDTGFVSFGRGWDPLRPSDYGTLWEHLVLEHLQAHAPERKIQFWRDAAGRELDFVVPGPRGSADVLECKWDPSEFDPAPLETFRAYYPQGSNYLIVPNARPGYLRRFRGLDVLVCEPGEFKPPKGAGGEGPGP